MNPLGILAILAMSAASGSPAAYRREIASRPQQAKAPKRRMTPLEIETLEEGLKDPANRAKYSREQLHEIERQLRIAKRRADRKRRR